MKLPVKINRREKRFLIIGGIIALLIITFYIFSWYKDFMGSLGDVSYTKSAVLEKQLAKLSESDMLRKRAVSVKQDFERLKQMLLKGEKPPVAAAELQRVLKEMASTLIIDVNLERTLKPVNTGFFLGIPVEIGFVTTTEKLGSMLYMIRRSPFLLTVSEMKVRVTNINNPLNINVTLQVMGFISKPSAMEITAISERQNVS